MRIATSNSVFDRKSCIKEENKKDFLVFEGEKTELIYFQKLFKNNDNDKTILFFLRDKDKIGWSNPKKISELIEQIILGKENCGFTYETILFNIYDYLSEHFSFILRNEIKDLYINILSLNNLNIEDFVDEEKLSIIVTTLFKIIKENYNIETIVDKNKIEDIISQDYTYNPEIDNIHFIVDRDKGSFKPKQYSIVLEKCKERNINFYVTNPFFEFWLLLHFTDCKELTPEELENNQNMIKELKKYIPSYEKSCYDANLFIVNIDKAIANSLKYERDIEKLVDNIGTNIPDLLDRLYIK